MGRTIIHQSNTAEILAAMDGKPVCDCCGNATATDRFEGDHLCSPCANTMRTNAAPVTVPDHITFPVRCLRCPVTGGSSCPSDISKTRNCPAC